MNFYLVRTKLQALIVRKIILDHYPRRNNILVFVRQKGKMEDGEEVENVYEEIKEKSDYSFDLIMGDGFLKTTCKLLFFHALAFFSGGKVLLAGIDSYPFAISCILFPFARIETFDDGSANILTWSKYYSVQPIREGGFGRALLKAILPRGCAHYLRGRSRRHFTIFPNHHNILPNERIVRLDWEWGALLNSSDLDVINKEASVVVLGTPLDEHAESVELKKKALDALDKSDLYIMHPREKSWINDSRSVKLNSPAESIVTELSRNKKIVVYHFNSTVAFSLSRNANIKFVDLKGLGDAL